MAFRLAAVLFLPGFLAHSRKNGAETISTLTQAADQPMQASPATQAFSFIGHRKAYFFKKEDQEQESKRELQVLLTRVQHLPQHSSVEEVRQLTSLARKR